MRCHQMEKKSPLLTHCEWNSPITSEFPSRRPVTGSLDFLSAPEQTAEQTIETPVIWGAIALIMTSLQWKS